MRKPHQSIRIFKNPFLEKLTHVHPITPLVIWGPFVCWMLWRSFFVHNLSFSEIAGLGSFGILFWTLTEYLLHRFVFHYEGESRLSQRIHFLIHGNHHVDPMDSTRLVMPPAASIFLAVILYSLFRLLLGPVWVEPFFGFFVIGYLCYDYIHFSVHFFVPKTWIGRYLKQSHMQHHYVDPHTRIGVSSPLWDYVFGTMERVKDDKRQVV